MSDDLPDSCFCPLTFQLMQDPVMDAEGNSYERAAIEEWLKQNPSSPISRQPLEIANLIPNRALKETIAKLSTELGIDKAERVTELAKTIASKPTSSNDVSLSVVSSSIGNDGSMRVLSSLLPEDGSTRTPVDIVCVVDVSGSMNTTATYQNEEGATESHGLSILDIVKHAVLTIIKTLNENDRLAIVAYTSTATVVTELTYMDKKGQQTSSTQLATLVPLNSTNLWDGLYSGMELLRKRETGENRLGAIFILTDGKPNVVPPRGHIPMLTRYQDKNQLSCTISSFGFGYSMDSPLLNEIALNGEGMYAFIPDSGFVGTTFVNSLSNLLSVKAKDVSLSIEVGEGYALVHPNPLPVGYQATSWGAKVSLDTLHYGQSRDYVFETKPIAGTTVKSASGESIVSVTASFLSCDGNNTSSITKELTTTSNTPLLAIEQQSLRLAIVQNITALLTLDLSTAQSLVATLLNMFTNSPFANDEYIAAMSKDVSGQISEAVSKNEFFNKWGKHYLPSLGRAHALQQCNNFKDPGIQSYGGKLFENIRDCGDDIFISLPPPQPSKSIRSSPSLGRGGGSHGRVGSSFKSRVSTPVSMSSYYCSSNPCFSGASLVSMADGTVKRCDAVRKGDRVRSGLNGSVATVLCVVKTLCKENQCELVSLGELEITPYHPVRIDGVWRFPCDIKEARSIPCANVFSYVLESCHTMLINDVECVSLGHNFTEETVAHPYFGSQAIVEDLRRFPGWENGLIIFAPGCVMKSFATDLICGFDEKKILSAALPLSLPLC